MFLVEDADRQLWRGKHIDRRAATMLRVARLIAVFGASPGIGKTTLAERLAAEGRLHGRVDYFKEEHVLSRDEFTQVAVQFRECGAVDLDVLLEASRRFVASAAAFDMVVTDALFPFIPSLLAWGHDEQTICSFLVQLRTILEPLGPVVVYLDGDPAAALPRAATRSGDAWLRNFVAKATTYKTLPAIRDLPDALAYLRRERDVTLRSMACTGYTAVVLADADTRPVEDLMAEVVPRINELT
jgi:hypothetical protein